MSLHWFLVKGRLDFKILSMVVKCLHSEAPCYLCELINQYVPTRCLRSENKMRLEVPKYRWGLSETSFEMGCQKLWNSLSLDCRKKKLPSFKKHLKTELFERAFV